MRKISFLGTLFFILILSAAEFQIVSDVKELKGDLTAQRYGHKDINGQWCAVLKIFTGIKDLKFFGSGYEKHDYKFGTYLVYMQPGSRELIFTKDEIHSKSYLFPYKLKANTVYGLELKATGEKLEDISINILGEPEDAVVILDGVELGNSTSIKTSQGKHELKVSKDGYYTYVKTIEVSSENTIFRYNLKADIESECILVQGGIFTLGSNDIYIEKPVKKTTVSDFYIGKTEITQAQWKYVMGNNPSHFKGDSLPVETVSWYDAVEFCNKLSEIEGLDKCYSGSGEIIKCNFSANGYRLPTESEWEYACRGGSSSSQYKYSGSNNLNEVGWYYENSGNTKLDDGKWDSVDLRKYDCRPHIVAQKKPNELGIYDMSGNVWEWCWNWYDENYYKNSHTGPNSGSSRVRRGGSWYYNADFCRVTFRRSNYPDDKVYSIGFRVVRSVR